MAEPRTLSVAWLPKGVLKSVPDRVNLEEDELLEIKEKLGKVKADESEEELESEDENMETVSDEKKALRPELEKEDSDVWDKFNLDDYDDEPGIIDPGSIGALVHEGEDEYTPVGEFDKEDEEDLVIKPEDHVLLAGVDSPEGTAAVEVRIFNSNEEYYVRNDIPLSGPPLVLAYINSEIGEAVEEEEGAEYGNNFVAVGTITSEIQIWDLDIINAPGPAYVLNGHKKDTAVVSLSWDGKNQLASGGTDGQALVWSLENAQKVALGKKSDSPINQIIFSKSERIITGNGVGLTKIFDKSSEHLFSSGHMPGASLTVWNVSKHLTAENVKTQPLAQYSRRRQKQGGKIFSTVLCPEEKSALVLVGGERGGPQVFKITQSSKKAEDTAEDDSDTEDEDEEMAEDAAAMNDIKEEEWETDDGSSEGEEIEE
ncbi:Oidioi.mRNA.OKI2018_I69.PAR.g12301.t1.cds [Oikopleura dioica]|uniref:Oidioi.mRNA.OKI2018_I69.PAR.g12301.t1.cds n=1 Tax=Oikopleura dioica TaxID=34765 RepID=A0ABN7RZG1_OIKDI|nr:Oidioi.mRNA.OKI2018_I69.PAR.g12301.t1.cds [Oikopleura dioica]